MMRALLCATVATVLLACGKPADQPEEPVWGKQPCNHCAMLLTEQAHGAQAMTQAGDRLFFDDLGCLVAWEIDHPNQTAHHWVRNHVAPGWLAAESARYQRAAHTPMDFGFVAVASGGDADWPQVIAAVRKKLAN